MHGFHDYRDYLEVLGKFRPCQMTLVAFTASEITFKLDGGSFCLCFFFSSLHPLTCIELSCRKNGSRWFYSQRILTSAITHRDMVAH